MIEESTESAVESETKIPEVSENRRRVSPIVLFGSIVILGLGASWFFGSWSGSYPDEGIATELAGFDVQLSGRKLPNADTVVVLLHGMRGNGKLMVQMAKRISPDDQTCFVMPNGPVDVGSEQYGWFRRRGANFDETRARVIALLNLIREQNPDAKLFMGGFSQGAILSSNFVEQDAELVDGLLLFSPSGFLQKPLEGTQKDKPNVFLAHGIKDRVLPFDNVKRLHRRLVESDYHVTWYPYDEGHVVSSAAMKEARQFLVAMVNGESPRKSTMADTDADDQDAAGDSNASDDSNTGDSDSEEKE